MKALGYILLLVLVLPMERLSAATRTWDGSANGNLSTAANWVGGVAPVNGDDLVFPASGVSRFDVTNNFLGGPRFRSLTFNGSGFTLWGAFMVLSNGIGAHNLTGINRVNCAITLAANQTFFINGDTGALLDINGDVALGARSLTVSAGSGALYLSGIISGSGGISKISSGTVRLDGSSVSANTYTGPTAVYGGTLELGKGPASGVVAVPGELIVNATVRLLQNGQIDDGARVTIGPAGLLDLNSFGNSLGSLAGAGRVQVAPGPVSVAVGGNGVSTTYSGEIVGSGGLTKFGPGTLTLTGTNTYSGPTVVYDGALVVNGVQPQSPIAVTNATLGGTGVVGNVIASGNVLPGVSPGILTCSNLSFLSNGAFFVELNGSAPGRGFDQLNVRGTVTLNNPTLHVSLGSIPIEGQRFIIIANDGSDATTGTFAGLTNGSILTVDGIQFLVLYELRINNLLVGNDVSLVVTNTPLRYSNFLLSGGNLDARPDPNECNLYNLVLSNAAAVPVTGIRATLQPLTPGWSVTQPFSTYPDLPPGAHGTNQVPFQVSLLPGYVCGTPFRSEVILETIGRSPFRLAPHFPVTLPGTPVRFDRNTPLAIPDSGFTDSTINVSGIDATIYEVILSLHITHPSVEDLDISLIDPTGSIANLSSDNGGAAANYGTGCADNQRTIFTSESSSPDIESASAPFVGTFEAESLTFSYVGNFGPEVNGPWTLRIADDTAGDVGTLQCWSLIITPSLCHDSGGPCESCPARTIFGAISSMSQLQVGRLNRNGTASACGMVKPCPGRENFTQVRFDAYTFENGESNACITVTLGLANSGSGCELFCAAYTNVFNPAELCQNYLADPGSSLTSGTSNSYSFHMAAHARFVVVVSQSQPSTDLCRYRLDVTGGSCRPIIDISKGSANLAVLDWTTAAIDYQLEFHTAIPEPPSPQWLPVSITPVITDSRYHVTNPVPSGTRFFRLRQP